MMAAGVPRRAIWSMKIPGAPEGNGPTRGWVHGIHLAFGGSHDLDENFADCQHLLRHGSKPAFVQNGSAQLPNSIQPHFNVRSGRHENRVRLTDGSAP
jgi:hypothetical protein